EHRGVGRPPGGVAGPRVRHLERGGLPAGGESHGEEQGDDRLHFGSPFEAARYALAARKPNPRGRAPRLYGLAPLDSAIPMESGAPEQLPGSARGNRRWLLRAALGAGALGAVALPLRRLLAPAEAAQPVTVGGLAVTCNLTLPIACAANEAANPFGTRDATELAFGFSRYTGWPELKESLMSGDLQAGYMLAPMVMDLADQGIPVKIVSIGHRSGAVIMVRTDSPYDRFRDLAGKRIAIPSRFAVDYLFLRKMLDNEAMTVNDVEVVEMAPADMPAALYVNGIDAYCTGEPFGAAAQKAGYARVLRMTRDEWPRYMCCVLTVREE